MLKVDFPISQHKSLEREVELAVATSHGDDHLAISKNIWDWRSTAAAAERPRSLPVCDPTVPRTPSPGLQSYSWVYYA